MPHILGFLNYLRNISHAKISQIFSIMSHLIFFGAYLNLTFLYMLNFNWTNLNYRLQNYPWLCHPWNIQCFDTIPFTGVYCSLPMSPVYLQHPSLPLWSIISLTYLQMSNTTGVCFLWKLVLFYCLWEFGSFLYRP